MSIILPRAFAENPKLFDGTSLEQRDPAYVRDYLPLLELAYRYYFRASAAGFERAPVKGPCIIAGNHNGGMNSPDTAMTLHAWYMAHGAEAPVHALIHPALFKVPYLNVHLAKLGGVAATARMAVKVLERGVPLLIYPGAGDDAYKPYEDRHRILFFGRDAFVRLALRYGAAILPLVSVGAHETLIVIDDGKQRAADLGLTRFGVERLPLTYSSPAGLSLGALFNIPFPARIQLELGAPIRFSPSGERASRDAATVRRCYDVVVRVMQGMLDRMVQQRASAGSS